jgi:uncharacterized protein YuzB (UPF0349 family)
MIVRLCQTQLAKLGADGAALVEKVRERGLSPVLPTCLDRCQVCERQLVATVDGMPLSATSAGALLEQIEMFATDDDV